MERISFPDHKDRCPHIQTGGPVVFCFFFLRFVHFSGAPWESMPLLFKCLPPILI